MASSTSSRDRSVVQAGIEYWETQPASLDGVLGGFGTGSLPRVDALGSRQFLLDLIPDLCTVPSAICPLQPTPRRYRALDVGAGIGRVTADVLLHLVSDIVLLEPVQSFVEEAHRRCQGTSASDESTADGWTGIRDRVKSVRFFRGALQDFDPARPRRGTEELQRLGYAPDSGDDANSGFDVVWCQWCLGHLNDEDLVAFLKRSAAALRGQTNLIVVKENLCWEEGQGARTVFDEQDSSWTRSDLAFKKIFEDAGLRLVCQKIQRGLPVGLYPVKMYALRPNP